MAVRAYGRLIAQIHALADRMPLQLARPSNDVELLVKRSIAVIDAGLPDRPQVIAYLNECAAKLLPKTKILPKEKPLYGMIHGDVIRANAQLDENGTVAVLDFDLCGPGWRVYDVASYLIVVRGLPEESEPVRAFLDGYRNVRPLAAIEQEVMPVFEAIRAIFAVGIPAMNVYHWARAYLDAALDYYLERLKNSVEKTS